MRSHDFEIEIRPDGEVKVHIEGVKGKGCQRYVELLAQIVGELRSQSHTDEYFAGEDVVQVRIEQKRPR